MASSGRSTAVAASLALFGALDAALDAARAQAPHARPARSGEERDVRGVVTLATGRGGRELAGAWVTLHRVGTDRAGPVDSARTDARGRFAFRYRTSGDSTAIYFVSSRYAGIAYFTPPLKRAVVAGGDADLILYDTTSAPIPVQVRGHHIVVTAPDSGRRRTVLEAYELSNDSTVTRLANPPGRPSFEATLPDGALEPKATDGEMAADAVSFSRGRLRVFAPIAPGVKRLSFRYRLPASDTLIVVASLAPTGVLEVLVEDLKGAASGAGLAESAPAVLDGRRFRRFLAQDAPANATISIHAPTTRGTLNTRIALIVTGIATAMLLVLARTFARRGPERARARAAAADDPETLTRELHALETAFANLGAPTAEQRADLYEARARLSARRTAALAHRENAG